MPRAGVFDFNQAIVRTPGRSVVHGLRSDETAQPRFENVEREHAAYIAALRAAGLAVEVLPALEPFPDSVFVEDPALVFADAAVLLRPGAASRLGEAAKIHGVLQRRFAQVLELGEGQYADGGDVLVTPETVFIGLSHRTNRAGAGELAARLAQLGRKARVVETPDSVLHLKSAVSLLGEDTLLLTRELAQSGIFKGFQALVVPDDEMAAANAVRINDIVLVGDCFPRTVELVRKAGLAVRLLSVVEIGKLDAGLSCMSLRWHDN